MAHGFDPNGGHRGGPPGGQAGARRLAIAALDPVPLFRDGLSTMIQRAPGLTWTGHATNHSACLQLCEQLRPDIIMVDSGLDPQCHLVRLLASGDPALLIIVLVRESNRDPRFLSTVLAAGAHGAVPRSIDAARLTEALRRAHADRRYLDPSLTALTARPKRQPPQPEAAKSPRSQMPLSRREYQVLQLVAEGLDNSAIAKILYLSVETVRTHVKNILRKLTARDRTHAVALAFRSGILNVGSDDRPGSSPEGRTARTPQLG